MQSHHHETNLVKSIKKQEKIVINYCSIVFFCFLLNDQQLVGGLESVLAGCDGLGVKENFSNKIVFLQEVCHRRLNLIY